jgi:1,4-dihydroxy-2-naphthoyl-CoA hydrolase
VVGVVFVVLLIFRVQSMPFTYARTIRFHDTDAAGVVYFANALVFCHEAYEESLIKADIQIDTFFGKSAIAIPIVQASVDFLRPMVCGDHIQINLTPHSLKTSEFEIRYEMYGETNPQVLLSNAYTRHICIHAATRNRTEIPLSVQAWLKMWGQPTPDLSSL